jgi:hypothetical protein
MSDPIENWSHLSLSDISGQSYEQWSTELIDALPPVGSFLGSVYLPVQACQMYRMSQMKSVYDPAKVVGQVYLGNLK